MTRLTDDDVAALLRETFADHEHLADPDRAVGLATAPGPRPRHGRVLLAAAAAVAVVAGGMAYVASRGGHDSLTADPRQTPTGTGQPPLPPLQTDAANRAAARKAAEQTLAGVPSYPGATTTSPIPALSGVYSSSGPAAFTVSRSSWWTVTGAGPAAVAQWYAAHPPQDFESDGTGTSSSSDGPTVHEVTSSDPDLGGVVSPTGLDVVVETTSTPAGTGVRVIVQALWPPARPLSSFVQDVTSIDVTSTHHHLGTHPRTTTRRFSVTDPAAVLAAAKAYDALPGEAPFVHSCPMMLDTWTDRIVFHTATGTVVATENTSSCGLGMSVARDGRAVPPYLGDSQRLLGVLGLAH